MLAHLSILILFLCGLFVFLWLLHRSWQNASLADVGFCLAFFLAVLACGALATGHGWRRALVVGMGSVYAFRLGYHLFRDRVWRKSEDARYRRIRGLLGSWESIGIFSYFMLQVPAVLFLASLLCWVMEHPELDWRWWDGLAVVMFLVAIIGEGLADQQLQAFRADPANHRRTLQAGLWRYSRHPNYFFESLHWWAYVPLAVGLPWWGAAVIWPLLMTSSLLWITGVPWAEAQALASRGDNYQKYQQRTNKFFPWFPSH